MVMLYFQVQASKQEDRKMQMDRLTNSRKPRNYDEAKARSERYARACRRWEVVVDRCAKELAEGEWRTKKQTYSYKNNAGRRVKVSYYTAEPTVKVLESISYWTGEAISWDGDVDQNALDEYASAVALAVLKAQGYRVAADADYDWVCNVLGPNADNIYSDAYDAVTESVDYIKSDY